MAFYKPKSCYISNNIQSPNKLNGIKLIIPKDVADNYYHHIIEIDVSTIHAKSESVPLKWRLLDATGKAFQFHNKLAFLDGSLPSPEFTLQVDDNGTEDRYAVTFWVLAYPRSLPSPQSGFRSFEKFEIFTTYSNESKVAPKIRYRMKNSEKWILCGDSKMVTISNMNDIYEVQAFYENDGTEFLSSPILIVEGHWKLFNWNHYGKIDLEELSMNKQFRAKINFQQSDLIATIRLIGNTNAINKDNKEVELTKEVSSSTNWGITSYFTHFSSAALTPGQYQVNLISKNLNITNTHEITVIDDAKPQRPKIFGWTTSTSRFTSSITEVRESEDYYGGPVDVPYYISRELQLLSDGKFKYVKTEKFNHTYYSMQMENVLGLSGKFNIIAENEYRAIIGLIPEIRRVGESDFKTCPPLTRSINVNDQRDAPAIFLPEIIGKIAWMTVGSALRSKLRLVCKKWLNAIPLHIIVIVTKDKCVIDDWNLELNKQ